MHPNNEGLISPIVEAWFSEKSREEKIALTTEMRPFFLALLNLYEVWEEEEKRKKKFEFPSGVVHIPVRWIPS